MYSGAAMNAGPALKAVLGRGALYWLAGTISSASSMGVRKF